jgi:hypothetical protein
MSATNNTAQSVTVSGQSNSDQHLPVVPTNQPELVALMEGMNSNDLYQDHRRIFSDGCLYIRSPLGLNVLGGSPKPPSGSPQPTQNHPWTEMRFTAYIPDDETDFLYLVDAAQPGMPPCPQLVDFCPRVCLGPAF